MCLLLALLALLFSPEDGGVMFLLNIAKLLPDSIQSHLFTYINIFVV